MNRRQFIAVLGCGIMFAAGATEELGNGFRHHGVATPISNHRGTVATVDGDGRDVVLLWLYDHRGGYALLMIDAATGRSTEAPMPFPSGGDAPFASILSSGNKFYTHFNGHFCEFDPAQRKFTFTHATTPQMAMGMTEADDGTIWSVTYPNSGVVSFHPATRVFHDYGSVHKENWPQYQRYVATDDAGWLYFAVGNTAAQIIVFDPRTSKATPLLPSSECRAGTAYVYRDHNGKVYGHAPGDEKGGWYELHRGAAKKIGAHASQRPKPIVTGTQELFHQQFPSGKRLKTCDLTGRALAVEDPKAQQTSSVRFDYTSEGAPIMGVAAVPDGSICGGTTFPMRFFSFNPQTDCWTNHTGYGQFNTVARQGNRFYFGCYGNGLLLEWDPARPWVDTAKANPQSNPLFLTECEPVINRPHKLLAHPDGHTLVLAGTPGYGFTGGGLLFWDRTSRARTLLDHRMLIPDHSTMSLVALPGGRLLGGTTTSPGTGGEKKSAEAQLYLLDLTTKRVVWHAAIIPGVQDYTDLCLGPRGQVFGIADQKLFFVFDPFARRIVHEQDLAAEFGTTVWHQGPRVFVLDGRGRFYILFAKGIAELDPVTYKIKLLARSPVPINAGGDYLNGRIYFASSSHLYSYQPTNQ